MTSNAVHLHGKPVRAIAALAVLCAGAGLPARALTIDPSYASSITSLPNASSIESEIQSAINFYDATFTNNITIDITFGDTSSGLGESLQTVYEETYSDYTSWLKASALASGNPYLTTAVSNLGSGNVPASGYMWLTSSQLDALGHGVTSTPGGTVDVNFSLVSISGPPTSTQYDGTTVIEHEINEILGIGGGGSMLGSGLTGMGSMDLYRYSAPGVPSFSSKSSVTSYFSIDGGKTALAYFNQTGGGSDFGDWATNCTSGPFLVQNAYGCAGKIASMQANSTSPEWIALQAVGYTDPVPEPSTYSLLLTGLGLVYVFARRQRRTAANEAFAA